ncbi:hypothetical protein FNV43_RR06170 [Rhamnella rubrinervis]|uniref:Uncharacterized protein n=1 Tax=Rhamnella rubrinervis TaxID=2594499 RepID=A0A8K0HE08_9ROSA|nr:hypothetical protein FNV43_RR06170 [Rhamnella rubrinervis]
MMIGSVEQQIREEALKYIANCEISEGVSVSDTENEIEEEAAAENTSTNITPRRHHLLKDLLLSDHGGGSFAPTASSSPPLQSPAYDCHSEGIAATSQPEATTSHQHNWREDLDKHEEFPETKVSEDKSKWRGKMEAIFAKFTNLIRKQPTPMENNIAEVDNNISEIYKQSNLRAKLESDRKKNNSFKDKQCWSQFTCCKLNVEVIKSTKRNQQNEDWKSHLEEYISSDTW